jgi:hypothetical protein
VDKTSAIREWLKIEYYYTAKRIGFINRDASPNRELILSTIRIIDYETTMVTPIDVNAIITLLALMWEHIDKEEYNLKDFMMKVLSRIGYPTSAIIVDKGFDLEHSQFSTTGSVFDKYTLTLQQSRNEVSVGKKFFLLTSFQKQLWDAIDSQQLLGISAPTSAGKSFVILIKTVEKMLHGPLDIIYIVPTLSLLNQVTQDYNNMLIQAGVHDYLITNNLAIGESNAAHTVYVWTQEKAISALSSEEFKGMPNKTILVVDEIQNIERISEDTDIRSKVLFDTLQELRHSTNVDQVIISGPRITHISELGESLFGSATSEIMTYNSPVLNLTYSIKKEQSKFYFKQYCGMFDSPYEEEIENSSFIAGYGTSTISPEYTAYLCTIVRRLGNDQNIIFAPTSTTARNIAVSLSNENDISSDKKINELIAYYSASVSSNYSLCETLKNGVAYHHGKLPIHVRRTLEQAIKEKIVSNVVCTTTLMQGVNMPAQNVIIRNPHLYTRHHQNEVELTSYEMANLRGRAGRLLKDFIGRTFVLDESEFEATDGYDQQSLFDDVCKDVYTGYGDRFEEYQDLIIDTVSTDKFVDRNMSSYGYLITYIRQSVLRYGKNAKQRMAETGVNLTSKQVAAIMLKLKSLSVPKQICLHNRYWDPFVLNDIFLKFIGKVPNIPTERGAQNRLSEILKFLRENDSTSEMYEHYVPTPYREGKNRGFLCSMCIKWSSETPLSELLSDDYYTGEEAAERIDNTIKLLQDTVSFSIPLLIKPVIEICNEKSSMVACLQAGAYKRHTRKMIEIGVPRELAINLSNLLFTTGIDREMSTYDFELFVRERIQEVLPSLPYWERVQLDFLKQK